VAGPDTVVIACSVVVSIAAGAQVPGDGGFGVGRVGGVNGSFELPLSWKMKDWVLVSGIVWSDGSSKYCCL
jgi:hypothetical protein